MPDEAGPMQLIVTAVDRYAASASRTFDYVIGDDQPPQVQLLSPPAGVQVVEGETVTVRGVVSDDRPIGRMNTSLQVSEKFTHSVNYEIRRKSAASASVATLASPNPGC